MKQAIDIYVDGSSKPNTNSGTAKVGFVLIEKNKIIYEGSRKISNGTNNFAELSAVKLGLLRAHQKGYTKANIFSDSSLVIGMMNNEINVKNVKLMAVYQEIVEIAKEFHWISYLWVKRNTGWHKYADQLSKV